MAKQNSASTEDIIDQVVALLYKRLPEQAESIETFIRLYYRNTANKDLTGPSIADLYSKVIAHWGLASVFKPGSGANIRVYNPHHDLEGWNSTHTIVEVVAVDAPFLVDSVRMAVNREGSAIHLAIHPVMHIERDAEGNFLRALNRHEISPEARRESYILLEIDRQNDPSQLANLQARVQKAILDVHTIVSDFDAMRGRLETILSGLLAQPSTRDEEEFTEDCAFLQWLFEDNFVFLGYREHKLVQIDGQDQLQIVPGSSLGLLRKSDESTDSPQICKSFAALSPEARKLARNPDLLVISRSGSESTVHRPGFMDYIGIKQFNEMGEVVGEHRFLGLYTSTAYTGDARNIPILRRKVANVIKNSGSHENSHTARALTDILQNFPRDEMFQISEQELQETAFGILQLQERQKTTLFIRRDPFGRFYSCLVFIPRDNFNTDVRQKIAAILEQALHGESIKFNVSLSEAILARVHFLIHIAPGSFKPHDAEQIQSKIVAAIRPWRDYLHDALLEYFEEEEANRLHRYYNQGFRADYYEAYTPVNALHDILEMEKLKHSGEIGLALFRPTDAPDNVLRFKLFRFGVPIALSEALPMLENMGLKVIEEHQSKIRLPDEAVIWIHDFGMLHNESNLALDDVKEIFQEAFPLIFRGTVSNDGFNRLTLRGSLGWRRVLILRAYARYLRQVRATFSLEYMIQALTANASIATMLIELFETRFSPQHSELRTETGLQIEERINHALDNVTSLDEDRIIRNFANAISATIRTNYYQPDIHGEIKDYLSFKIDSSLILDMPEPRPKYEIFVYSTRVEGIHLRSGSVARGGLRWSDRSEDFRTEVLGLVKAQKVKNVVIVPTGSKGGFVAKQLPLNGTREQIMAEGIACYRTFISALLDLTDNIVDGEIEPPVLVVRHDHDDPYLVVAADKGTATFSDIANSVAADYRFWLGDAFASGGSVGYDHKAMGITARGAWESVKRHLHELGLDTNRDEFRVIGIGDMSGDVFGNGMLLSRKIKLVGAFNHQHIFLDPEPDCESTFEERQRLFRLPRSGWDDYNKELISQGGGVYLRSAKKITLSAEAKAMLGLDSASLTPNELIRAMLKAQVDLLWNGGIGTYVKATNQPHADVGDRANEAVRINGNELRCRVVGEGGNLGLTQLGRIEYALNKGHIFTDAIDNSAGVDCSDHEVNIKILLNAVIHAGEMTVPQRNDLLVSMTEEVAALVLNNNYQQTKTLSLANTHSQGMIAVHARLIRALELRGSLNRAIEYLPSEELLQERMNSGQGLTSPELSVLMAYVKIDLYDRLIVTELADDPYLQTTLLNYFPTPLRGKYPVAMNLHRLRREIIITEITNYIVNRAGISFVYRMVEETAASVEDIARAYTIIREIFGLAELWREVEALDGLVANDIQMSIYYDARKLLERAVRWIIQRRPGPLSIEQNVERYTQLLYALSSILVGRINQKQLHNAQAKTMTLIKAGVPEPLAVRVGTFDTLSFGLELVETALDTQFDLDTVVAVYFQTGERLQLNWLRNCISSLPRSTHWQAIARGTLRDDIIELHNLITSQVLYSVPENSDSDALESWINHNKKQAEHCFQLISELNKVTAPDYTMLSVVLRELRILVQKAPVTATTPAPGPVAAGAWK